ncbi:MAG: histidine phosphatase family protein [Bdellovibrionota bacterium]
MTSGSVKTLVLIRHAHRDKVLGRAFDNGLSLKGFKQAKVLGKFFKSRFSARKPVLFSSPKKRCYETLFSISKKSGSEIKMLACLDEGGDLDAKIAEFFTTFSELKENLIVICSHGDWIPEFIRSQLGFQVELSKAGWIELIESRSKFEVSWIVQKPDQLN